MEHVTLNRHIIPQSDTLLDALHRLNEFSGQVMTLLAVDADMRLTGTLTDGDVRRALINGSQLTSPISEAMHRDFRYMEAGCHDVAKLSGFRRAGYMLIPVLDSDGTISTVIDMTRTSTRLPMSAILMAGGKGERLRPLTLTTPKPLLEIDGKPIIDYNVEALAAVGITDITVTTRYLAHMLHSHFSQPVAGIKVKCMEESQPLGTIGAVSMLEHKCPGTTLVMNADLLTDISFEDMYLRHIAEKADITVASLPYSISVPYAILATEGATVTALEEKPTYSYYANAGIYMISNSLLASIPEGRRTDATDLIEDAIKAGKRVVYFPINGTWIDIGSPADFRHAQELMRHARNLRK